MRMCGSLEAFTEMYARFGYTSCVDGSLEEGYLKVALYLKSGIPSHAARQLPTGEWGSKLGEAHDIHHRSIETLFGDMYGTTAIFFKKAIAQP